MLCRWLTPLLPQIALAHYPCGPASDPSGLSFELAPGLGWANAVPDADAAVNLNVNGEAIMFTGGSGYHDKVRALCL